MTITDANNYKDDDSNTTGKHKDKNNDGYGDDYMK